MTSPEERDITPPARGVCPVCGDPVQPQQGRGQPRRYCSSRCKSRAARDRLNTSPGPSRQQAKNPADRETSEQLRVTQSLSRDAAIDLVAADPDALAQALRKARPMLASPILRATSWREVAVAVAWLAGMIPDDTG